MPWNPYEQDNVTRQAYRDQDEQRAEMIERRMADRLKQLELYDSAEFAWFLSYLDEMKVAIEKDAIQQDDPIAHAKQQGRWGVISHLLAIPQEARLEYEVLKTELAELRPEASGTL